MQRSPRKAAKDVPEILIFQCLWPRPRAGLVLWNPVPPSSLCPSPRLQLTSGKRFRTKSLAGESKLERRLSRAGRGWGSTAGGGPRVPDPSWMQEQSGFALQAALGTPGCTRGHGAGAAAGRAVCAPLPPLRAARTVPRLLPSSSQPRAVAGAQSWAGGSGGTGSLFVKAGPSKATRPAENEPAGRSARRARAYLAEPAGGRVSPARSARRERFPEEEGREGAPRPVVPGPAQAAV